MSATVATAEGVVVRAFDGPSGPTGWQFSWDGRDENGALVAAGPYTVTVSGTDLDRGSCDSETFTIDLATPRSQRRRVGNECVCTSNFRWSPDLEKKTHII